MNGDVARSTLLLLAALAPPLATGCDADRPRPPDAAAATATAPAATATSAAAPSAPSRAGRVEIREAPASGDVAPLVAGELAAARADGRVLLVYVGAAWCEPCQYFHRAAAAGELDREFPALRLYEFDLDRDRERLEAAGYGSRMIPLWVAPRADGTGSPVRIAGSIKGAGAVAEITPRLADLVARAGAL